MTSTPIDDKETAGLLTLNNSLGLATLKQDSPARFVVSLETGEDGREEVWVKYDPIKVRADGFGLHGWYVDGSWMIQTGSDAGKLTEGGIVTNERGEAYTRTAYNDKKDCIYRSIANPANRASGLAVDPGQTGRVKTAQKIADLTKVASDAQAEAEAARREARKTELQVKILMGAITVPPSFSTLTLDEMNTGEEIVGSLNFTQAQQRAWGKQKSELRKANEKGTG